MNDHGTFAAVKGALPEYSIYTHCPQDVQEPYLLFELVDVRTGCFEKRVTVNFVLTVVSKYKGIKEVQTLMTVVQQALRGEIGGMALRLVSNEILTKGEIRKGRSEYQAWIGGRS